jgi:CheY-like chemotaxis protein
MASILVIDDEPSVRGALMKILSRAGHEVRTAADGPAGIALQGESPAQVAVIDIMMPRMNGVTVIEEFKRLHPGVRIVAISGGGNFGSMGYKSEAITTTAYLAAAEKAGADALLTKPFDRQELLDTLKRLVA